ncbi:MAG TPA: HAMP domain-containing sensor histidine kinase [Pirellula sp.]|nr:HAMP domain-containing sensor histidine kinase [Pirellula sp.]
MHVFSEAHISTAIWLTQLRWVAVAGQLLVIGYVWFALLVPLPIIELLLLVTGTAISNTILWLWGKKLKQSSFSSGQAGTGEIVDPIGYKDDTIGSRAIGMLIGIDVLTLTALLYFSGGAANPFVLFYFANIAIAGMILPRIWAWSIPLASILGGFLLLNRAYPLEVFEGSPLAHNVSWGVTKYAFFIAFSTCCCVITYFVSMLAMELRQREVQLAIVEKERERSQRLEALATLAAGAGHELASPLSTIAVVAKELSRNLEKIESSPSIRRDVELIREELNRCKEILHRMKSGAGEAAAENLRPVSLSEVLRETVQAMREPQRINIQMPNAIGDTLGILPKQALSQALRNLLQNGLDASKPEQSIDLNVTVESQIREKKSYKSWRMTITDQGSGMTDEVQRRVGEPFFTTKEVGQGMGLGVFLTRNVILGLGGEIDFKPSPSGGTICKVTLPV